MAADGSPQLPSRFLGTGQLPPPHSRALPTATQRCGCVCEGCGQLCPARLGPSGLLAPLRPRTPFWASTPSSPGHGQVPSRPA